MARCPHRALILTSTILALTSSATHAQEAQPTEAVQSITIVGTPSPEADVEPALNPGLTTLHRFLGAAKARWPRGGVAMDSAGNLYGTTLYDGPGSPPFCSPCGIIYKLTKPAPGKTTWTFTILRAFKSDLKDGIGPTAPLIIKGNVLFGTTSAGGDPNCGCGTVFRINTNGGGYKQLYVFRTKLPWNPVNGSTPIGGLIMDSGGTLYGTTSAGGNRGAGVIFRVSSGGGGFKVLHHFVRGPKNQPNGGPQGELMWGKDGYIYGAQFGDGKYNEGTIFRIGRSGSGFQVIYNFKGVDQPGNSIDGAQPEGRLAQGGDGTIYGTTSFGGTPSGYGTAWSLKLVKGKWVYKQLRRFTFAAREDANLPHSGVVLGSNGVLYGTGAGGGFYQSGALYKLTPPTTPTGKWGYKTLFSFKGRDKNGDTPYGVLLLKNATLFGMNLTGGHIQGGACGNGCGTVFGFRP